MFLSGCLVAGDLGGGEIRDPQAIVGEAPNIAARLQELTVPNTVVCSAATARLVEGYFALEALGPQVLKGVATPMPVYRVGRESTAQTRFDLAMTRGLTPLVGREQEVALLLERWAQVKDGTGQVVLLSGEPGIGKSRLVQVLKEHVAATPQTLIEWRGAPDHQQSALFPVIAQLHRRLRGRPDAPPSERLHTLEAALAASGVALSKAVPLLAALLSLPLPASYPPLTLTPRQQRQQTFETLLTWLHADTQRQPGLAVVEDLHWLDPSTLELLSLLIDQSAERRLCLVLTARPEFHPPWPMVSYLSVLTLRRLAPDQIARVTTHVAGGKVLPPAVLQEIVRMTDGVPLFVEELTKTILETQLLEEHEDSYTLPGPLSPLVIPASLHDALLARLDRLAAAKGVAQLGATIGRTFAYAVLHAVSSWDEAALQHGLRQLEEAELVYQRGVPPQATYRFKHALIQEIAYQSLLKSTRQQYHQCIAQVLEAQFPEISEGQPELMAYHALRGEVWDTALVYCRQAGDKALARSAYPEAVTAFEQALGALQHLPENRIVCEQAIDLRIDLCFALWRLGNWRGALDRLREAEALAEYLDDQHRLAQVSSEMADGLRILGDDQRALLAGQRALTLAIDLGDRALQVNANTQLGLIYYSRGDYERATAALRQTVTALAHHTHRKRDDRPDAYVWPWSWLLACFSQVGAFVEGKAMMTDLLRLAEATESPFSLAVAIFGVGLLSLRQGDLEQAIMISERGLAVCQLHDLRDWLATLAANVGYAYALVGRLPEALTLLEQAVRQYAAMRGGAPHSSYAVWLGEAYLRADRQDEAYTLAQSALTSSRALQQQGNEAYALRLLGDIAAHHVPPDVNQAAAYYRPALVLAKKLGMHPLQAHCHRGLGMLYAATGQREQARAALSAAFSLYRTMEMTFWLPQTEAALAQMESQ